MRISRFVMAKVGEAECVPRGYGLAYWDSARAEGIFYLIPFNLLARFSLWLYWKVAYGLYPNKFESRLRREYDRGHTDGRRGVYKRGVKDGIREGRVQLQKEINDRFDKYLSLPIKKRQGYLDSLKQ